jgi:hypothetical protein
LVGTFSCLGYQLKLSMLERDTRSEILQHFSTGPRPGNGTSTRFSAGSMPFEILHGALVFFRRA